MKRIGLITDCRETQNPVQRALAELAQTEDYSLETIDDFRQMDSLAHAIWSLINLVDVVVAYVARDARNIYYEIGLAHGAGKPVVIVSESLNPLPPDLMGQRILVDSETHSLENLAFLVREAIREIGRRGGGFSGYRGPREQVASYPVSAFDRSSIQDFRSVFAHEGPARARYFTRWLAHIARAVPGWEVVEPERVKWRDDAFDLVIWNSREDYELSALGNPIAVELKSVRTMNSSHLRSFLYRAKTSGLKGVVFATTGTNDPQTSRRLARLRREEGISAISVDRDDLIRVVEPDDLVRLFKEKVRELLYREGF